MSDSAVMHTVTLSVGHWIDSLPMSVHSLAISLSASVSMHAVGRRKTSDAAAVAASWLISVEMGEEEEEEEEGGGDSGLEM